MNESVKDAWKVQAKTIIRRLNAHGMDAVWAEDSEEARRLVADLVADRSSVSWGGTQTFAETGVKAMLEGNGSLKIIDRSKFPQTPEGQREAFLEAVACDYYFMSANAVTFNGELVNIDGNSNRTACLLHGPRHVVALVGMNKIVPDVDAGIARTRTFACPPNAVRLNTQTPCGTTGVCAECHGEGCMCCNIVVTRHSRAHGRIKVILIGEELGF